MKKTGVAAILIVMMVGLAAVSAFSAENKSFLQGSEDEVYYMVPFVSGVEYWFPVYEMFKQAGQQLGVKTKYLGTPEYDVNRHLAVFEQVRPAGRPVFLLPRSIPIRLSNPSIAPMKWVCLW